jgi:hypothetical protein
MKKKISLFWNQILDFTTPPLSWFVTHFMPWTWALVPSKKIAKSLQTNGKKPFQYISEQWFEWMLPQNWYISLAITVGIVFLPQILIFFLTYFKFLGTEGFLGIEDLLLNTWQILASILGISFVIIVFLTQYAHDRDYERRAFPLFASKTMMVFTVLVGMLTILSIGINLLLMQYYPNSIYIKYFSLYNFFLFILNIIFVIQLYINTYIFLLPRPFQKAVQNYSLLQIKKSVYDELVRRIHYQVIQDFCKQREIEFSYSDDHKGRIRVKLNSSENVQEIVDINLTLLDLAYKRAKKYSSEGNKGIIFAGQLNGQISKEHPEIAFVTKDLSRLQITGLLVRAAKFSKIEYSRSKQNITDDVLLNRDLLSDAIQSGRSAIVESLLDQYVQAIKSFLDAANAFGIHFSPEMALKENSWFKSWPFIDEIRQQYVSLLDTAIKSGNIEIMQDFVGYLFNVMRQALEKRDHFVFSRFAHLFPVLYHRVWNFSDDKLHRDPIFDHCGRLLYEIQNFKIEQLLKNPNTSISDLSSISNYSNTILLVLNDLLKETLDAKDFRFFTKYSGIAKSIPNISELNDLADSIEIIKIQIDGINDPAFRIELETMLERKILLLKLLKETCSIRKVMFMGFGGWLVHCLELKSISKENYLELLSNFSNEFSSLEELNTAFDEALRADSRDVFPWNSWEMNEWAESYEGKSGSLQYTDWIDRFYALVSISLLPPDLMNLPTLIPKPNSQGILDILNKQLEFIKVNETWQEFNLATHQNSIEKKIGALIQIHQVAVDRQNEIEEIELSKQDLDIEIVSKFKQDVEKSWEEGATFRILLNSFGRYYARPEAEIPEELRGKNIGIHKLTEKSAFVKQNRIIFPDWGNSYGRGLASGENRIIQAEFASLPEKIVEVGELERTLENSIKELRENHLAPIILYGDIDFHRQLYKIHDFEPSWRSKKPASKIVGFEGYYKDSLVVRISEITQKRLILVDLNTFGLLAQYRPSSTNDDFPLYISVYPLLEADIEKIYKDSPKWLMDIGKGKMPEEAIAKRKIQQQVGIKIFQRFRIEEKNNNSGVQILIKSN